MHPSESRVQKPRIVADPSGISKMESALNALERLANWSKTEDKRQPSTEKRELLNYAFMICPALKSVAPQKREKAINLCKAALRPLGMVVSVFAFWANYTERRRQIGRKHAEKCWKEFDDCLENLRGYFPELAEAVRRVAFEPNPTELDDMYYDDRPDPVVQAIYYGPKRLRDLATNAEMKGLAAVAVFIANIPPSAGGTRNNVRQLAYEAKEAARREVYEDAGVLYPGPGPAPIPRV